MRFNAIKKLVVGSIVGAAVFVGMSSSVSAQKRNAEYREWLKAQRQAQKEQRDYMRSRNMRDYREWQEAQRRAQEEYAEYQRSTVDPYYRNDDRVYGGGYYNNDVNRRYRVYRDGSYYSVNEREAEQLRAAVNNGYRQGYRQGQLDRQYGRRYDYQDDIYRDGRYGYGSYAARSQYEYYFQQGFQRGYEDGYNSTSRYGYRSGNQFNILSSVLSSILNLIAN